MTETAELPLTAGHKVELVLTDDQVAQLQPLFALQICHRGAIFVGFAQSYSAEIGAGRLRLQLKLCGPKPARKALKILRESNEL